jgi:hypothetical protein
VAVRARRRPSSPIRTEVLKGATRAVRGKDVCAGAGDDLAAIHFEAVVPLEDVPPLVLFVVDRAAGAPASGGVKSSTIANEPPVSRLDI